MKMLRTFFDMAVLLLAMAALAMLVTHCDAKAATFTQGQESAGIQGTFCFERDDALSVLSAYANEPQEAVERYNTLSAKKRCFQGIVTNITVGNLIAEHGDLKVIEVYGDVTTVYMVTDSTWEMSGQAAAYRVEFKEPETLTVGQTFETMGIPILISRAANAQLVDMLAAGDISTYREHLMAYLHDRVLHFAQGTFTVEELLRVVDVSIEGTDYRYYSVRLRPNDSSVDVYLHTIVPVYDGHPT